MKQNTRHNMNDFLSSMKSVHTEEMMVTEDERSKCVVKDETFHQEYFVL